MDQLKIGKFIAERRKAEDLTQMQLAEKLCVTDRAVSKWETGKSLPDSSIMLKLCEILKISVTELLMGEKNLMENNNKSLEEMALEVVKQKEKSDRTLLALEWVIGILSCIVLIVPIIIAATIEMEEWQRAIICLTGIIPAFFGFFLALRIEQVAGYYKCKHCGHTHVPTYNKMLWAQHVGRTRYMKCPKCGRKSWQKKVVNKD